MLKYDCRSARLIPIAPSAPSAPANPINAPDIIRSQRRRSASLTFSARLRSQKTDGISLNTDPLPMPQKMNSAMNPTM